MHSKSSSRLKSRKNQDRHHHPSVSELDRHRFVVNNKDFVQNTEENICIFNMGRMRSVLRNAFYALKGWFEDMSETLVQVLNADVPSPVKSMKKVYQSPKLSILLDEKKCDYDHWLFNFNHLLVTDTREILSLHHTHMEWRAYLRQEKNRFRV